MPLFKKKPFSLLESPKHLDPEEKVFQIRFTKEIFLDYQYPLSRHCCSLTKSLVFICLEAVSLVAIYAFYIRTGICYPDVASKLPMLLSLTINQRICKEVEPLSPKGLDMQGVWEIQFDLWRSFGVWAPGDREGSKLTDWANGSGSPHDSVQ